MATLLSRLVLLLALCMYVIGAHDATSLGKPFSVPPSQFWDGSDGPWSTFRIGVGGHNVQQMRVLPASGQSSSLLVLPEACYYTVVQSGNDCSEQRGGLYMRNISTTWDEYGQYHIDTYLEKNIGVEGDGLFGFDDLSLGWTGDKLPTLKNQSIAGVLSPSFELGSLSLNARPINFTSYNSPITSMLQNLRNMPTPIPSLSWSYTAGAYNLAPKVFGSLVLGGYDSTRFEPNNITFPFGKDVSLDLQVAIQRITVSGTADTLLSQPIISYISTLVPDIWLPSDACTMFTKIFRLSFNTSSEYFYINSTMHQENLANNPIVSFQVGPEASGPSTIIKLPYWNFYLAAQGVHFDPGTMSGTFRFPLRRASNESQYILGRAFLQSAYLSTDYERQTFNLSQALYPTSSTKENIVPILPPGSSNLQNDTSHSKSGLSTGAIAGVVIGGAVALLVLVAVLILLYRRRQKDEKIKSHNFEDTDALNTTAHEIQGDEMRYELQDGSGLKHEMVGDSDPKVELSACIEQEKPVEAADTQFHVYELPANEKKWVEMEGEGHIKEMR